MLGLRVRDFCVLALLVPAAGHASGASAFQSYGRTQGGFGMPARIYVALVDASGVPIPQRVSMQLYKQGEGVYSASPLQSGEQWFFEVYSAGTYIVEVSAPGYRKVQESASVSQSGELVHLELRLRPERPSGGAAGAPGPPVLAPKAKEEMEKGARALREHDLSEAQAHLEAALRLAPGSPEVNYFAGMVYLQLGHNEEAIEHLQKTAAQDPRHAAARYALGEAYFRKQDYMRAAKSVEEGLALRPDSWRAHWLLGAAYLGLKEYAKGRDEARAAIALGKDGATGAHYLLGECLVALGDRENARTAFEIFLEKDPSSPAAESARHILQELRSPVP